MPTKRQRRARFRQPDIDPVQWSVLTDQPIPDDSEPFALLSTGYEDLRPLWKAHGTRILAEWVELRPGTRPSNWWVFDAPRALNVSSRHADCFYTDRLIEPRRVVKGGGRPAWERYAYVPSFHLGIPKLWTEADPETLEFESQYEYLKRHDLLHPDEGRSEEPRFLPSRIDIHA